MEVERISSQFPPITSSNNLDSARSLQAKIFNIGMLDSLERTTILTNNNVRSIGEFNRFRTRHLMQHPLVEPSFSSLDHSARRLRPIFPFNESMTLLQYQKLLKESKRLEVELRKKTYHQPLIEILEGQTCFESNVHKSGIDSSNKTKSSQNDVDYDNLAARMKLKKLNDSVTAGESSICSSISNKSTLRKCQSDNLISEKRYQSQTETEYNHHYHHHHHLHNHQQQPHQNQKRHQHSLSSNSKNGASNSNISDNSTSRFLSLNRRTHSFNTFVSNTPFVKSPKVLPGRPNHLSNQILLDNFKAHHLPPIRKRVDEQSIPKYIDQLKTLKNNTNFCYSIKTNAIFPKVPSLPKGKINNRNGGKMKKGFGYVKNDAEVENGESKISGKKRRKKKMTLSEFRRLSSTPEDFQLYSRVPNTTRRPSMDSCDSPTYLIDDDKWIPFETKTAVQCVDSPTLTQPVMLTGKEEEEEEEEEKASDSVFNQQQHRNSRENSIIHVVVSCANKRINK